jgi:aerobic-type carbon monoxide dehydrogenase small subunit (CoxS/CutS family)
MRLTVNHQPHDVDVPAHETLLSVLRDRLHLTGAKLVCGRGECGACTVLVDGAPAYACLTLAIACEGSEVTTIEGIGTAESLHPLQRAFVAEDALQCGYCTPGQILAAMALLAREPRPDEAAIRRGMSGNLCRCGTYPKIGRAVQAAALEMGGDAGGR